MGFTDLTSVLIVVELAVLIGVAIMAPKSFPLRHLRGLPYADTRALHNVLVQLQGLVPAHPTQKEERTMSAPTPPPAGAVWILQSDLDTYATNFQDVFTALQGYIITLQANQATPLSEADEAGLAAALATGQALEPPPTTPVTPSA